MHVETVATWKTEKKKQIKVESNKGNGYLLLKKKV